MPADIWCCETRHLLVHVRCAGELQLERNILQQQRQQKQQAQAQHGCSGYQASTARLQLRLRLNCGAAVPSRSIF